MLPALDVAIGRPTMLDEQQPTASLQHAMHLLQGVLGLRNRA